MESRVVFASRTAGLEFLEGGGEMGERIRTFDWVTTPVGELDAWPQSLRTTLSIMLHSKFPMLLWWGDDLITFYNDAYRPALGGDNQHPGSLGQKGEVSFRHRWPVIKPLIDQVLAGGERHWAVDQLSPLFKNGKLEDTYWTLSYGPVMDEAGKIKGVMVVCYEHTDKVRQHQELQEKEDQLRFAIDSAELATWDFNPLTNKFTANDRLKEWFGLDPKDEIELPLAMAAMIEEDRERVIGAIEKALTYESGGYYDIKYTVVNRVSMKRRIVRGKGRAWFNDDKKPYRFNGTLQDITDQEIAQKRMEESALFARNIIHHSEAALLVWMGEDMVSNMVNEKMLQILGRNAADILDKPFMEAIPELKDTPLMDRLRKVLHTGETFFQPEESFTLLRHGKPHTGFYNYTCQVLKNAAGENYGIINTAWEVTDQVIARQQLEQAEEKAIMAIDSADLGTYEINLITDHMITSDRFNAIWGMKHSFPRSEIVGFIHPDDRAMRQEAHDQSIRTGWLHYEARVIWNDQSAHWVRIKGKVLYNEEGKAATLIGVIQDITEQKLFADEMTKQVKERTLEFQRSNEDLLQFAHVISHDLKEPVRKVKLFTNRLQEEMGDQLPDRAKVYLDKVQNATNRMFSMIEGVLTYSALNSSDQVFESIALGDTIQHIQADLEVMIHQKNAQFQIGDLPVIEGASVLIYQLFYNLINNALKFSISDVRPVIAVDSSVRSGVAKITVTDNGIGFDQENAEKIFSTFARLHPKDKFEGTGLGLALCQKIAERHGGSISATSAKHRGAVFTVALPVRQNITRTQSPSL